MVRMTTTKGVMSFLFYGVVEGPSSRSGINLKDRGLGQHVLHEPFFLGKKKSFKLIHIVRISARKNGSNKTIIVF